MDFHFIDLQDFQSRLIWKLPHYLIEYLNDKNESAEISVLGLLVSPQLNELSKMALSD